MHYQDLTSDELMYLAKLVKTDLIGTGTTNDKFSAEQKTDLFEKIVSKAKTQKIGEIFGL